MRSRPYLLSIASLILAMLLASGAAYGQGRSGRVDQPQNLILLVDISGSMTRGFKPPGEPMTRRGNDPEGLRWDGVQFAIDVAGPKDRIALVVFKGDAVVLTQLIRGSDGGFLEMEKTYTRIDSDRQRQELKGRELLKQLVREIQDRDLTAAAGWEENQRALETEPPVVDGTPQRELLSGTATLHALQVIARQARLLDNLESDRPTKLFLFTDGYEELPPEADAEAKRRYAYIHRLPQKVGTKEKVEPLTAREEEVLDEIVEERVGPFREKKVPIFTFGLGSYYDPHLLQAIARKSVSKDREGPSAPFYHSTINRELLDRIQSVTWQLRNYIVLPLSVNRAGEQEMVEAPRLGLWHDAGFLLYRKRAGKVVEAEAPRPSSLTVELDGKALTNFDPLASRSHLFYRLDHDDPLRARIPPKPAQLVFKVAGATAAAPLKAFAAVRTELPLFEYVHPAAGSRYYPIDAIPFRVDFRPPSKDLTPDECKVTAKVTRGKHSTEVPLEPEPADNPDGSRAFVGEWIPDRDPDTKGNSELIGAWDVDVTITFKGEDLKGARQELLRRSIEIIGYPRLRAKGTSITLSNKDAESLRGSAALFFQGVRLGKDPQRNLANLTARIASKPGPGKKGITENQFSVRPQPLALRGKEASLDVEAADAVWSVLTIGEKYQFGSVRVRPPWSRDEVEIQIVLEKTPNLVNVVRNGLTFDLTAREVPKVERKALVSLATPLATGEQVWLSTRRERTDTPAVEKEMLCKAPDGKEQRVTVAGLGVPLPLQGGSRREEKELTLTVTRPENLPVGEWTSQLWVVGSGVDAVAVPVTVRRERLDVRGPDRLFFDLSDTGQNRFTRTIKGLALASPLATTETVAVTIPDAAVKGKLEFRSLKKEPGKKEETFTLSIGQPQTITLAGEASKVKPAEPVLELQKTADQKIEAGRYEAKLVLIGEGTRPHEITIHATVDQPRIYLLKPPDASPEEINELKLVGIAGTKLTRRIAIGSALDAKLRPEEVAQTYRKNLDRQLAKLLGEPAVLWHAERADRFRLGLRVAPERVERDHLLVECNVPAAVREGDYRFQLTANLATPGARPLLVALPILMEVRHYAARTDVEDGTLTLAPLPDKPHDFKLLTDIKDPALPVRWRAELADVQPGLKDRIDVTLRGQSVLKAEVALDPVFSNKPCPLKLHINGRGLAPGWYRAKVKFIASADPLPEQGKADESTNELTVKVLVPGRIVRAEPVRTDPVDVGKKTMVRVTVTCYGCTPETGRLLHIDEVADRPGDQVIDQKLTEGKPETVAEMQQTTYRFLVSVTPRLAGTNRFEVRWPVVGPEAPDEVREVTIRGKGVIEVPAGNVAFVGEEVLIRATVPPPAGGGPVTLTTRPRTHTDAPPASIQLFDDGKAEHADARAGDGVYSGKHKFEAPGEHTIGLPDRPAGEPEVVLDVAFDYTQPDPRGSVIYGGADFGRVVLFWRSNVERTRMKDVVRLQNHRAQKCDWHAVLLFPTRDNDTRAIHDRNLYKMEVGKDEDGKDLSPVMNPKIHLDAKLLVVKCSGSVNEDGLSGTLGSGEQLVLGVKGELSDDARQQIYNPGGSREHSTLGRDNGMVVQLVVEWLDGKGDVMDRRELRSAVSIETISWRMDSLIAMGVLGLLGLVGGVAGYRTLRARLKAMREQRLRKAAKVGTGGIEDDDDTARPGVFSLLWEAMSPRRKPEPREGAKPIDDSLDAPPDVDDRSSNAPRPPPIDDDF